jgi:RNA polymerase sigma-70 factor (ECF subfamily)
MRLDSVLRVIYLIFNEGYAATRGDSLIRTDLCDQAIRLGRRTVELLEEPEAMGQLSLMLLHEARRSARADAAGDLILLEDQDRSLWDRSLIAEGLELLRRAFAARRVGPYVLQAAIAAVHTEAHSVATTNWAQIVTLYDVLARLDPSPVVALNRAVAIGTRDGPEAGLALIESVLAQGGLDDYHLAHAARADMQRRLGLTAAARMSYQRALDLTRQPAERRFLERRLAQVMS